MTTSVAVLVGSLRKDSHNRKLARALVAAAPSGLDFQDVEIGDLPLYNEDLEAQPPASWTRFRAQMADKQAVLFVTPEYNRSLPATIKNAIDVGSRPYGKSIWSGKPAAIATGSLGAIGGFGANHALRQCLVFLDMPIVQQPEMYVGHVDELFDAEGKVSDPKTHEFLGAFMKRFANLIERATR